MPPKRNKSPAVDHNEKGLVGQQCFPSLGFLSSSVLLNQDARHCINNYDNPSEWRVPRALVMAVADEHSETSVHSYLVNINLNPHLGFCTICEKYSWLTEKNQMAGPCWRCKDTEKAKTEPPICEFTRRVLRRWGYTSHDQGTAGWLKAREDMLTASDAYVPLGIKGYKTAKQLLLEKAGIALKPAPSYMMTLGNVREPIARQKYELVRGVRVYLLGLIPLPNHPWLGASPDGITSDGKLIEIKCPSSRRIGNGLVPPIYVPQVQLQLQALEVNELDFIQFKPGTPSNELFSHFACEDEFTIRPVLRDDKWFAGALPKLKEFHEQLQRARGMERAAIRLFQAALLNSEPLEEALASWQRARRLPIYTQLVGKRVKRTISIVKAKSIKQRAQKGEEDFSMCENHSFF